MLYRWTYVHPQPFLIRNRSYFSFGLSLHKALEKFVESGSSGVPVQEQLADTLAESWIDKGYTSSDEMAESFGEGIEIIRGAKEQNFWIPPNGRVLEVEKSFKLDMGEFNLVGRVDRLDEHEDGTLEIVDYKTSKYKATEEYVREDIAFSCYQTLVRAAYPGRKVQASLIFLRDTVGEDEVSEDFRVTVSMTDEEHEEFLFVLKELGSKMLNHNYYELAPVPKPLCSGCDFISLCRRHPDYC